MIQPAGCALVTALLVYLQIIVGGIVRHTDFFLGPRLHMIGAFAVIASVVWLIKLVVDLPARERSLLNGALLLAFLVIIQLFLRLEAWLGKFRSKEWPQLQPLTVIFALMVGGQLGGIAGAYLSVPAVAVLRILWLECFSTKSSSDAVPNQPLMQVGT